MGECTSPRSIYLLINHSLLLHPIINTFITKQKYLNAAMSLRLAVIVSSVSFVIFLKEENCFGEWCDFVFYTL